MVWYNPGLAKTVNKAEMRLVDVVPTLLKTMGIPQTSPTDGRAYELPIPQGKKKAVMR